MLFTSDHEEPRRALQKFIAAEINPFVDEWEKADIFPAHELFKKLGDLGFLGLNKPTEFGGQGLDYSYALMMAEELGAITCGGVPMAIGVQTDMATPALARFGSDEVRREFLAPAISGDAVACIGVSEPGAGSDVASIKTSARSDGDDYVINGGKMWITNGVQADWICLLANTGDGAEASQQIADLRADEEQGRRRSRASSTRWGCARPTPRRFSSTTCGCRSATASARKATASPIRWCSSRRSGCGARPPASRRMKPSSPETIEYTRNRKAFGQSILDNQIVHFKLAEMQTEVELLRALIYRAARSAGRRRGRDAIGDHGETESGPAGA